MKTIFYFFISFFLIHTCLYTLPKLYLSSQGSSDLVNEIVLVDETILQLPIVRGFDFGDTSPKDKKMLNGRFNAADDNLAQYVWVPSYSGQLSISLNGNIILDDTQDFISPEIIRVKKSALIDLGEVAKIGDVEISIANNGSLSVVYYSKENIYKAKAYFQTVFANSQSGLLFILLLFVFVPLLLMYLIGLLSITYTPILAIIFFLLPQSSGFLIYIFPGYAVAFQKSLHFWPILAWGLYMFLAAFREEEFDSLARTTFGAWEKKTLISSAVLSLILFFTAPVSIGWHILVSIPAILIVGVISVLISLKISWVNFNALAILFATILSFLMWSVLHQLNFLIGVSEDWFQPTTLSGYSILIFLLCYLGIRYSFFVKYLLYQKKILNTVLSVETEKRILENELNKTLMLEANAKNLLDRLIMDLHDGVMGTLQTIKALTESRKTDISDKVHKLSSFSLDELRIILGLRDFQKANLATFFVTLGDKLIKPIIDSVDGVSYQDNFKEIWLEAEGYASPTSDLIRVFQEAINNAFNRGHCSSLIVDVGIKDSDILQVKIFNNGGISLEQGHIVNSSGSGIANMRKRIENRGGKFSIRSVPGGAEITFTYPICRISDTSALL